MKLLFISATNTDIGKTFASLKLIDHFSKHGITVGVCKPIETGIVESEKLKTKNEKRKTKSEKLKTKSGEADATKLLKRVQEYNANFKKLKPIDITAYTFSLPASPFSADIHSIINIEKIKSKIEELSKLCELLIIEGAGGLMVPIKQDYMMIDLAKELKAEVLLITSSKLGCINDTMLSIEALKNREIKFDWCVNLFKDRDEFEKVTQPFYDKAFPQWWSLDSGLDSYIESKISK